MKGGSSVNLDDWGLKRKRRESMRAMLHYAASDALRLGLTMEAFVATARRAWNEAQEEEK